VDLLTTEGAEGTEDFPAKYKKTAPERTDAD
jgi:hypothetical protein